MFQLAETGGLIVLVVTVSKRSACGTCMNPSTTPRVEIQVCTLELGDGSINRNEVGGQLGQHHFCNAIYDTYPQNILRSIFLRSDPGSNKPPALT